MKLFTVIYEGKEQVMIQNFKNDTFCLITALGFPELCMNEVIDQNLVPEIGQRLQEKKEVPAVQLEQVTLCAPVPRPKQDVICLGINYAKHMEEAVRYREEAFKREAAWPIYFSKRVNRAVAHGETIRSYPGLVDSLDYETELAVILGKDAFSVSEEDAFDYVFGYTIVNDVSARNLQTRHKQWYFGKSLDTFTPMGPCIVTKDEFDLPPKMSVRTWVNGELRQDGSTELLIFDIPHVISELSQGMTLEAGTIISMGTPAGVGMGFQPPRFLKRGDRIRSEIEGIGVLENIID